MPWPSRTLKLKRKTFVHLESGRIIKAHHPVKREHLFPPHPTQANPSPTYHLPININRYSTRMVFIAQSLLLLLLAASSLATSVESTTAIGKRHGRRENHFPSCSGRYVGPGRGC
ncbi:hypothetical protein KEM48_003503 [Puccinia striiformis f. sp. tritici PST-130]|nr:hypothetical protein KEM48_003503 [Puccinia striiformis f. sp. tritici PST-130]